LLNAFKQLSEAFNNLILWIFPFLPVQAVNIAGLIIVGVVLWKFSKKLPWIVVIALILLGSLQIVSLI
jgi:hypothetical protein